VAELIRDLAQTNHPVIVFVHQRLDEANVHSVAGAAVVRGILEHSAKSQQCFRATLIRMNIRI